MNRDIQARPERVLSRHMRERLNAYAFVLPALVIFIFVIVIPTVSGFVYSFTDWSGMTDKMRFIGISNYSRLFRDPRFYVAVKNTLFITVIVVTLQNFFGLMLAVLLNTKIVGGRNIFRSIFFIPSLLSIIVIGYTWLYILNVHVGLLGIFFRTIGVTNVVPFDVFLKPIPALITIALTMVWQFSGYNMVIYLAGLQSIPTDIYESASVDGATAVRKFFNVTLPLIMPSITVNMFLNIVGCLRVFEQVYVMTKGGPGGTTETVGTYVYNAAFSSNQMGYGTAISMVLFAGTMMVTFLQVTFMRSREVDL